MLKFISKAVSYMLHPFFMPVLGVLILLSGTHLILLPLEGKITILKVVAVCTILLPASILPIMYYQKLITHVELSQRSERLVPIFISVIFYATAYYTLHRMGAPLLVNHFLLATVICLALAGLIHLKWKISLHMIGIGGIIGLLSAISFLLHIPIQFYLVIFILLAGTIGTARLYLQEHSQEQIYGGFLLGFVATFGILVIMNNHIYG